MRHLQLTDRIKNSPRSQRFYKTQSFKPFISNQIQLKRYDSTTTDFQSLKTLNKSLHRSLSSKHKVFKSAKKIDVNEKKRSNSFKNFSSHTSENFSKKLTLNDNKQFPIPKKSMKLQGGIINEKKAVQDIMSRLRNKNSIRIEVRNELIINENRSKNIFNEQVKEPQLNLKNLIKDQVTKRIQEQRELTKPDEQMIKMKSIIEQKSNHFQKLQREIGSKINWIQSKMEQFQERQMKIKQKQETVMRKEKQMQANLLKKLQEKHKNHQLQLQKQFTNKINQIKAQQNTQKQNTNQYTVNQNILNHKQIKNTNRILQKKTNKEQNLNSNHTQNLNPYKTQNQKVKNQQTKINKSQLEKNNQPFHVDIDQIQEISSVQKPKPQKTKTKTNKSQNLKQSQVLLKKPKNIQTQQNSQKTNNSSQNKITQNNNQDQEIQEIQLKPEIKKTNFQQKSKVKIDQQKQKTQQNASINTSKTNPKQENSNSLKVDKNVENIEKSLQNTQKQHNQQIKCKNKQQKLKIVEYLKVLNRVTNLLYFIGEIPHHCNTHMKKIKKYQFKVANLYLFKYVYDKFRFIQKVFAGLITKKAITQEYYKNRVDENQIMKETYKKLKTYVYKKQPFPPKQCDTYLNEDLPNLCFENKNYFNKFLFKEIKTIVDFYHKDTKGKWNDHKVNLCYFRMLIAVFIIQEIEFNFIVIDPEQNEHPDYMIGSIQKLTENQLRTKMDEAYQLFNDLDFTQEN